MKQQNDAPQSAPKSIIQQQKDSPYFTPSNSGNAFLLSLIFLFGIALIINMAAGDFFLKTTFWSNMANIVISMIIYGLVFLVMSRKSYAHKKLLPLVKPKPNYKIYAISAVFIVLLVFCMIMFNNIFVELIKKTGYQSSDNNKIIANWWQFLIAIFIMCCIPAVIEEVIFRGIIYNGLRRYGSVSAIAVTSIFFMFLHGGLYQTFYQVMLSVILILAIKWTGDLKLSMFMHFINNVLVLVLSTFMPNAPATFSALYIVGAIMLFAVGIALIFAYNFVLKKTSKETALSEVPERVAEDSKIMMIIAGVVGVIFYIYILMIGFGVIGG